MTAAHTHWDFAKMHACGNDFALFNTLEAHEDALPALKARLAALADRHTGIGYDQCLIVRPPLSDTDDFYIDIYNADGARAGNCINGMRCAYAYLCDRGLWVATAAATFYTGSARLVLAYDTDAVVATVLDTPVFHARWGTLYQGRPCYALEIGNPHLLVPLAAPPHDSEVAAVGHAMQTQGPFAQGANVSFVWRDADAAEQHYRVRTYERGVGETHACGSAAAATRLALGRGLADWQPPDPDARVALHFAGGCLTTALVGENKVSVASPVASVFAGRLAR